MFGFFLAMVLCFRFMSSLIPAQAAAASYTLASGVKAASDDMEEQITGGEGPGNMDTHSSDIEIGVQSPGEADEEAQYIGIRFADLAIPAGAAVTSAYIQFTVDEEKNGNPFDIRIVAEDVDNAETYNGGSTSDTSVPYDISNRYNNYSTAADVNWALAGDGSTDWLTEGVASELQRTPDIATLVQAVVDRPGWASGNAISFLMYGSGCRTAISYENDPTQAAVLHVTFEYDGGVLDQAAPTGLEVVAPTTDANDDGQITGTTTAMEYRLSSDSDAPYTACSDTATTGLVPGDYDVRYAETEGYNASPAVTVTVPAYTAVVYTATDITFQPGSDESSMNFTWYSNVMSSTESVVQVAFASDMTGSDFPTASASNFSGSIADSSGFKSNEVSVTGLVPDTAYVYRLGDGTSFSEVCRFTTHDPTGGYNAILVGDPQIGSSGNVESDTSGWKETVTKALSLFADTSFILSAGDQVEANGNETQYAGFFAPEELTSVPLIPTIGNHDNGSLYQYHYNSPNESAAYGTTSAGGDYWFTYGNTLYMILNSNNQSATSHEAFIGDAITAAGSDIVWKIVMFHHSIYSSASHSTDGDILSRRSALYPIFDNYDIAVGLMGHDHCYTRSCIMTGGVALTDGTESSVTNPAGTLYITANSGSGSKYYDLKSADTAYAAFRWQGKEPSYSNIEVTDSSFTITTYKTASSDVIDTYTILKDETVPYGLLGVKPTTTANDDGQITGTTAEMEYKLSASSAWIPCGEGATIGLVPGTYEVRYADVSGVPGASVTVIIESVLQDQDAPVGIMGVAPTTTANDDGQITGTTAAMEYKPSSGSGWTACTGASVTGLAPGDYDVRYAEKTGYNASPATTVTVPVFSGDGIHTVIAPVKEASDDMEEWVTGDDAGQLDFNSSDLEIGLEKPGSGDGTPQYVGIRFADLGIPAGATITDAYIQFTVDEVKSPANPFSVSIVAEDSANAATFNSGNTSTTVVPYDISSRAMTAESVTWALDGNPTLWTVVGEAGEYQRTPDLSSLVQTIIDKDGWASGNAMTFILHPGAGNRTAVSYDKDASKAPVLHVTYTYDGGSDSVDFAVLTTTDEHGKCWDTNVLTGGTVSNSMLKVATAVDEIRDTYGDDNVVLIDNGDIYQGTPVSSYHIAQLTQYLSSGSTAGLNANLINSDGSFNAVTPMALCMKYIGYDVSVLGNHEFNYDWDAMSSIYDYLENDTTAYASIPVLAANLYNSDGTNAFTPYITKDILVGDESVRIGILGMENTDCTRWDVPENYPGITFATDSTAEVEKYVPLMKADGCDFIILSYHSGLGSTSGDLSLGVNTENQIARVIANTAGIDMVIAGHDHSTAYSNDTFKNAAGDDVLVVNGGGSQLTESVFTAAKLEDGSIGVTLKSSRNLTLTGYENDAALQSMIEPYAVAASEYVSQDVGMLVGDWDSVTNFYLTQSDTIDLINRAEIAQGTKYMAEKYAAQDDLDALYAATGLNHISVDMASTSVVVDGSYTASAGALTMKNIYQMYKYANTLYLLALTGQEIKDILEYNAQYRLSVSVSGGEAHYATTGDDYTNPIFYGLDFTYDMALDPGSRVIITGFSNGNAFDLGETYVFAVNNYHLGNGPFAAYSTDDAIWSQTDDLGGGVVQDLIAEYVSEETAANGGVSPEPSGWSLSYSGSLEDDLDDTAYIAYKSEEVPSDGDTVILYYNDGGTVVGNTAASGYAGSAVLAPADVTLQNNVLYAKDDAAAFLVSYDSGSGTYTFSCGGKYLTSAAAGNSLSLTDSIAADGCSYWTIEETDGGFLVHNVGAAYSGNHNQYLEYYSGFTTYGYSGSSSFRYVYSFYTVIPAATYMESAPADGDQVVVWYNAGSQIIGAAGNADGRLVGVDSATAGSLLPVNIGSAVFDVHYDGSRYSFTCDGKYLTSAPTGNGLGLTDAVSDYSYWTLENTDGGWLVPNVNAKYGSSVQYLEYYKTGFTTYGLQSNLAVYTYNFYAFNGYAPEAPTGNEEQEAPTGLTGVAPTTASNNDGSITGTTAEMEYKMTSGSAWTACTGSLITGLLPGDYDVRYAAKDGFNASPSVTVTVSYYGTSTYIVKDLTLQPGADETMMNFCWYSGVASAAQVQIAPASAMTGSDFPVSDAMSFDGTAVASGSFISNEADAAGLTAGTDYVYRVGDGTNYGAVYSFSTRDAESYGALLVGDPQIGCSGSIENDLTGWQATLTTALGAFPDTSFLLSAGDQVETASSESQYDGFFAPAELSSLPLVPTIGNHDNSSALYSLHYNSPNESDTYGTSTAGGDYWFTYGDTLYMVLNSNNMSTLSHETFLGEAIAAAGEGIRWRVVMFHHSIYSSASHSTDSDILARRNELYPVFDAYNIDVVLMGHDHCYTRSCIMNGGIALTDGTESSVTNPEGTLYITANSASGSKYYDLKDADTGYMAVRWQGYAPSYSYVEVTNDSFTVTTYQSSDNSVIDTYTIYKDDTLDQPAPEGLAGVAPTTIDNKDGKITGTSEDMEYRLPSEEDWTSVTGSEITGLVPGTYEVRYAAKEGYHAGEAAEVTVPEFEGFGITVGDETAAGKVYKREISVAASGSQTLEGKYLAILFTEDRSRSASGKKTWSFVFYAAGTTVVYYESANTKVEVWLINEIPDAVSSNMSVEILAYGRSCVPVESVSLDRRSLTLYAGESEALTATVKPNEATNKAVLWSSSSESVATVDENGAVTAVSAGTATITATTVDGEKTAKCQVTVRPSIRVTGVKLSQGFVTARVGQSGTLRAIVYPYNATNKDVTWSSSDPNVVTVDAEGNYTAKKAGTASITATTADGAYTVTCPVNVINRSGRWW
jgi:2',3'-cyclic-nucleotide 2'-phosphodiesterase (5'-nucleotidase family)/uncharacterized protein YjdB